MKKIPVQNIDDFFACLASRQKLYIPVDDAGKTVDAAASNDAPHVVALSESAAATDATSAPVNAAESAVPVSAPNGAHFTEWRRGVRLAFSLNTTRSAKDFFFPQTENLFDMKISGKTIDVIDTRRETEDFIVFGVRACDVQSFAVLDTVFLANPVDTYYKNRREHATIISLACVSPRHTCFCNAFAIDAANPAGDIRSFKTDSSFYFEALTPKGRALLDSLEKEPLLKTMLTDADESNEKIVRAQQGATKEILSKTPIKLPDLSLFSEKNLKLLFDSPVWAELSSTCLACGTCTFVCPTCQCYDIREFDTGSTVRRYRCWDSCMYSDFTQMSAGQPRETQLERFRQRFMHKLVYFPANNGGMSGCVGCGRCLSKCPISMNIVKVAASLCAKTDGRRTDTDVRETDSAQKQNETCVDASLSSSSLKQEKEAR